MLFDSWYDLLRVLLMAVLSYTALIVFLRITGKRTLSKLNAFDLVITVSLGSTLATIILTDTVSLSEGVLALWLLVCLQFAVTWLSTRSERFLSIVKAEPRLLFYRGRYIHDAMHSERITRDELLAVLREHGIASIDEVGAVVLETDGSLSVLDTADGSADTLHTVRGVHSASAHNASARRAEPPPSAFR